MSGILSAICTNYAITSAFPSTAKVLVVGGGGGGGISAGGGGGAGGFLYDSAYAITNNTSYAVTVGAGGAGGTLNNNGWTQTTGLPTNGGNSVFGSLTAIGGGKGGSIVASPRVGGDGGSGGGGCGLNPGASGGDGGLGTSGQGFDGGDGNESGSNFFNGAGGGGAGEASATVSSNAGTKGGDGVANLISGSSVIYGGGGGGSGNGGVSGLGGAGGGGAGSVGNNNATNGTNGLGGGGGGARCDSNINGTTSGAGGSGVVIISYVGSPIATGGTITSSGGNTIHTFTSSGSFVVGTPPVTYATWNPADKSSGMILETGNLVGHSNTTPGEWTIARSTIGKSSGKWYWEQKKDDSSEPAIMLCGILNISAPVGSGQYVGIDTNGWGYWGQNGYKVNSSQTAYGSTYTNGDIIGIALDMDNGTLEFFKNGVSQGVMATGLTGTQYAGVSTNDNGYHTVNFGASALTYTPPVGFNAGLYE